MARLFLPRKLDRGRTIVVATVLLAVTIVLGGILLATGNNAPFQGLDDTWNSFGTTLHSPFWDDVNVALNWTGYTGMFIFHGLLALALLIRRRPIMAVFSMVSGVTVMLLTQLLKWVVHRPRPEGSHVATDTYSYPSGHVSATTAFVLVVAVLIGRGWAWLVAISGMLAMMMSRVYLAAHWLTDVVGGACLASGVVLMLWIASQTYAFKRIWMHVVCSTGDRERHAGRGTRNCTEPHVTQGKQSASSRHVPSEQP